MSFLTPLYLLGALAIALPILAHLIRRTPPRRREFSSVQFLTPSQPKVTRRSRIEHWLLLCLRALVIGLLAIAFARPLWRTSVIAEQPRESRWAAVLLDTSASLRRDGLWEEALSRLETVLSEYGPDDHVGIMTFDIRPQLVWSWDAWRNQDAARRPAAAVAALDDVQPSWHGTDLGAALIAAAESLQAESGKEAHSSPMEVVVISDVQSGSRCDALQGYAWPEDVPVRLVRIGEEADPDNAGLQPSVAADLSPRIRVSNAANSRSELFSLQWAASSNETATDSVTGGSAGAEQAETIEVVVPAGQSRIVRAPPQLPNQDDGRLMLLGDTHPFDNACYVAVHRKQAFTIAYLGSDDPANPAGQRFYMEPLFADTPQREVSIVDWNSQAGMFTAADSPLRLIVVTGVPDDGQIGAVRDFVNDGGLVIHVLGTADAAAGLAAIIGSGSIAASEADVDGFSLLTDIDFDHPALAPFADPKFSDFTALHFWAHRTIDEAALPDLRVLARFDNGDLAIGEIPVGAGHVIVMASGWNRSDSQLAVWSKFVPLMNGLLESQGSVGAETGQLTVGEVIPWRTFRRPSDADLVLTGPDGSVQRLSDAGEETVAEVPGVYAIAVDGDAVPIARFAVNLAAAESKTDPMGDDQLESLGVPLAASEGASPPTVSDQQILANAEVEQRQRLWRWALFAALALLFIETLSAGWLTRRSATAG